MARKSLKGKLEATQKPVSWKDQGDQKADKWKRKTYLLTDELVERIQAAQVAQGVPINEFIRFGLTYFLDQLESGELELPTEEVVITEKRVVMR